MSDYIEREALDKAFTDLRFSQDGTLNHWGDRPDWCLHGQEIEDLINSIPAADVVEVVRCGDCRHCSIDYYPDGNEPTYTCLLEDMGTNKDFYCANGERVSEDD